MFLLLIVSGMLLLLANFLLRKKMVEGVKGATRKFRQKRLKLYLYALYLEWKNYAFPGSRIQGMKGLAIALSAFLLATIVNSKWLQFSPLLFLPLVAVVIILSQIKLGRRRQRIYFEECFPEVLATINAAVSSGNSIHQALSRCGDVIEGDMGTLFNQISRRLNYGEDAENVFLEAWRKYPYQEFYFFIVVLVLSLRQGGQIRVLIGRLARLIANNRAMMRKKAAMTSEARASAKIIAAIPILFFIGMKFVLPEDFNFVLFDETGRLILYYVLISEAIGMGIIWYLLRKAT